MPPEKVEVVPADLENFDPNNPNPTPVVPPETPKVSEVTDDTEVEVNGEKIKISELKAGHMRQSDYTKKMQELAEERKNTEKPKEKPKESEFPEADRKTAKYLLDIALKDPELRKEYGLLTERDLAQRDAVRQLTAESESLVKEFDGKNGLPKFNEKDVLEHMQEEGFRSMRKAYIDMVSDSPEYIEWLTNQKKGSTVYKTEGKGAPIQPKKKEFPKTVQGFKDQASSILDEILQEK